MWIIYYPGQTCFGPFSSVNEAIAWTEKSFQASWRDLRDNSGFACWYVENPDSLVRNVLRTPH